MATRQRRRSLLAPLLLPLIPILFTAYFAWHGWHGSFGVEARHELDVQADRLRIELAALSHEKAVIERRVELLRAKSLDSDMLDERGREVLGFAQPNELALYPGNQMAVAAPKPINKK